MVVTVPAESDRYAALVEPADATAQSVNVQAQLRTAGGAVSGQISDQPPVAGGVAKTGVGFSAGGLVTLSTTQVSEFPQPVVHNAAHQGPQFIKGQI